MLRNPNMQMRYVVTGVSSGVGFATATRLMEAGAEVIGLDLKERENSCTRFIRCDLSSQEDIERAVTQISQPIHGLVNVAGVPGSAPKDLVFAVNFLGLRHLTDLLLPHIEQDGAVVNVASAAGAGWRHRKEFSKRLLKATCWPDCAAIAGELNLDATATYDYSKELVILYSMYASSRERHRGVRVNSVSPGAVQTPILKDFYDTMDSELLNLLKRQAGGRDAYASEIAGAILLLLSADSYWVNGTDLLVDGGAEVAFTLEEMANPPSHPLPN